MPGIWVDRVEERGRGTGIATAEIEGRRGLLFFGTLFWITGRDPAKTGSKIRVDTFLNPPEFSRLIILSIKLSSLKAHKSADGCFGVIFSTTCFSFTRRDCTRTIHLLSSSSLRWQSFSEPVRHGSISNPPAVQHSPPSSLGFSSGPPVSFDVWRERDGRGRIRQRTAPWQAAGKWQIALVPW